MPVLHGNHRPLMTLHVVESGVLRDHPFTIVDIGAAGGYHELWDVLGTQFNLIGFEPRRLECKALNAAAPKNVMYLPYALSDRTGSREFFVARQPLASSFCSGETAFMRRFPDEENLATSATLQFDTRRLDDVLKEQQIDMVDFLKIDVDGAELDVLSGATETLHRVETLGVVTEFWLHQGMRKDCSTFSQIDQLLVSSGFRLYDVDVYRHSRKVLMHPTCFILNGRTDNPPPRPTPVGQVMTGDALYFKDYVGDLSHRELDIYQILKLACLFDMYGMMDSAAEVILHWEEPLSEILPTHPLLDLLTKEWTGTRIPYDDYMENGPISLFGSRRRSAELTLLERSVPLIQKLPDLISRFDGKCLPILAYCFRWACRKVANSLRLHK